MNARRLIAISALGLMVFAGAGTATAFPSLSMRKVVRPRWRRPAALFKRMRLRARKLLRRIRIRTKRAWRNRVRRLLNPKPTYALERMYRSGRISHHQLETYHNSLKARGINSGLGKLLKKPARQNDPISRETNRLRRLAERSGWVD